MEFTPVQVRRLRDRLVRYRESAGVNGRHGKWRAVAKNISEAPAQPETYRFSENYWVFGEALRRFANGISTCDAARLEAIATFLKSAGYLSDVELASADPMADAAMAMQQAFGASCGNLFPELQGHFSNSGGESLADPNHHLEMRFLSERGVFEVILLSDTLQRPSPDRLRRERRLAAILKSSVRLEGWAVATRRGQAILLLRDPLLGQQITYLVLISTEHLVANRDCLILLSYDNQIDLSEALEEHTGVSTDEASKIIAPAVADWARANHASFMRLRLPSFTRESL